MKVVDSSWACMARYVDENGKLFRCIRGRHHNGDHGPWVPVSDKEQAAYEERQRQEDMRPILDSVLLDRANIECYWYDGYVENDGPRRKADTYISVSLPSDVSITVETARAFARVLTEEADKLEAHLKDKER